MAAAHGGFRTRYFKHRVALLLLLLLGVAVWWARVRVSENRIVDWSRPHRVVICPLVASSTDATKLASELEQAPALLDSWTAAQREYWTDVRAKPFAFEVQPAVSVEDSPPWLPGPDESLWTRFRMTSRFLDWLDAKEPSFAKREGDDTRIWLYVYRDIDRGAWEDRLPVGTKRGRMGVVFASDDPRDWGNVLAVIAHETLHAVGAKDHRNRDETIAFPEGYADPSLEPRFPQKAAEIMALGIPVSEDEEARVESLDDVAMGLWTAKEIGWR